LSTADRKKINPGWVFPFLFGGAFLFVGSFTLYIFAIRPMLQARAARNWVEHKAIVETSEVGWHSGSKGSTTYSVDIFYGFTFDGREYSGDRYNFIGGSSSGYSNKKRIVDAYPQGKEITIYVNPADPHENVITRELGKEIYFGLLPLIFVLIGAFIFILAIKVLITGSTGGGGTSKIIDAVLNVKRDIPAAFTLKRTNRFSKFLSIFFFGIVWNGFVGTFLILMLTDEKISIVPLLFMTPFVIIGIVIIGQVVAEILRFANPCIILQPPVTPIKPGEPNTLSFKGTGKIERVSQLTIFLVGEEFIETKTGSKREVRKTEFYRDVLQQLDHHLMMQQGSFRILIPADQLQRPGSYNGVSHWRIEIKGVIPRWPDLFENYPLIPVKH